MCTLDGKNWPILADLKGLSKAEYNQDSKHHQQNQMMPY